MKVKDYINSIEGAERRFISNLPEVRSEADRTISGLGIVYNSLSQNFAPWARGGMYEMIEPGAALGLLDDPDIMVLFNHSQNLVLARNKATATLEDTPEGVKYSFSAPNTTTGNDLLENVKLTNIRKSSFAFIVKEERMEKRSWPGIGDINLRVITRFEKLFDFSPVTYPAYESTSVKMRSLIDELETIGEEKAPVKSNLLTYHDSRLLIAKHL